LRKDERIRNFPEKEAVFKISKIVQKYAHADNDVGSWRKWGKEVNVHFAQYSIKTEVPANSEG